MPPQFNNLGELSTYLESMEQRVKSLESQNESLQRYITDLGGDAQKMLPKTSLLSTSFIQRAFAVWGHYFVAQLAISIPILCIYLIFIFLFVQNGIKGLPTP
jgi:hypothetical protein